MSNMKVVDFSKENSVMNRFVAELRDVEIQKDSLRFRKNVERIGEIIAYELSKDLEYIEKDIITPLGISKTRLPQNDIVISTILRAGLAFHQGFLNYFDRAENAFVSAYRKYIDNDNFDIHVEYIASPLINEKVLLIVDPMLATGGSMELSYKALLSKGEPTHIHIASVIASRQAIDYLKKVMPADKTTIWVAAIDEELNDHAYIVPGLGDAGDLCYGEKEG